MHIIVRTANFNSLILSKLREMEGGEERKSGIQSLCEISSSNGINTLGITEHGFIICKKKKKLKIDKAA